ncbi:hypothetical protein BDF14DRAFT_486022 [Spinellus fusiger]|nr:hypothetical protein BDF14DRAFT_486022 [Spinellus fusiger]
MVILILAPYPKKPSTLRTDHHDQAFEFIGEDVQDACQELRQILAHSRQQHQQQQYQQQQQQYLYQMQLQQQQQQIMVRPCKPMEQPIVRTSNPLPQDSSFIPLHQAVSHLQVSECPVKHRPRSYSSCPLDNLTEHIQAVCIYHTRRETSSRIASV